MALLRQFLSITTSPDSGKSCSVLCRSYKSVGLRYLIQFLDRLFVLFRQTTALWLVLVPSWLYSPLSSVLSDLIWNLAFVNLFFPARPHRSTRLRFCEIPLRCWQSLLLLGYWLGYDCGSYYLQLTCIHFNNITILIIDTGWVRMSVLYTYDSYSASSGLFALSVEWFHDLSYARATAFILSFPRKLI